MEKSFIKITVFLFAFIMTANFSGCSGGGSAPSGTGTTDDGITVPAGGKSGIISITGGTNKYGFHSLWKSGTTSYPAIYEIFRSTDAEAEPEECYFYFGDNNIYLICLHNNKTWYLLGYCPYSYSSVYKTFTSTGPNPLNSEPFCYIESGVVQINGNECQILDKRGSAYNFFKAQKADSFSETVTSLDEATLASLEDEIEDNTLVTPLINSLTASYSSGTVTFSYNITAPAGYNVNSINIKVISPSLYNRVITNGDFFLHEYFPVYGQVREVYKSISSPANNVSGTATLSLTGPENGTWYVTSVDINCSNGKNYDLSSMYNGEWNSTYYYEDDDVYKNTGISAATFNVSGSTADTTPPTLVSLIVSGTTITITGSDALGKASISYVADNHYPEEDGYKDYWADGSISGSTATFNLSGAPAGSYYIARISLFDIAGNCSVYFGYDTDVSLWSGIYPAFGLDLTKYNRYWSTDSLPTMTIIPVGIFTK